MIHRDIGVNRAVGDMFSKLLSKEKKRKEKKERTHWFTKHTLIPLFNWTILFLLPLKLQLFHKFGQKKLGTKT